MVIVGKYVYCTHSNENFKPSLNSRASRKSLSSVRSDTGLVKSFENCSIQEILSMSHLVAVAGESMVVCYAGRCGGKAFEGNSAQF